MNQKIDILRAITRGSQQDSPPGQTSYRKWPPPWRDLPFLERCGCFLQTGLGAPSRWVPVHFLWRALCPIAPAPQTPPHIFPLGEVAPWLQDEVLMLASNCIRARPHSHLPLCPPTLLCGFPRPRAYVSLHLGPTPQVWTPWYRVGFCQMSLKKPNAKKVLILAWTV